MNDPSTSDAMIFKYIMNSSPNFAEEELFLVESGDIR